MSASLDPQRTTQKSLGRFGEYEAREAAGVGAMATVFVANAPRSRTKVAVKRLHASLSSDRAAREALAREAQLARHVLHPNVVRVHDLLEIGGGEAPVLVMEWIDGLSLATLAARMGRLSVAVAVAIACDVLRGLHAAHEAKTEDGVALDIVHCDVSPENILVGRDGVARITDFGVARTSSDCTASNALAAGKLGYMAPEQLTAAVDRRADLYAVGAVLWELVTGRAFRDTSAAPAALLVSILHGAVTKPSEVDPRASVLEDVLLRALARDPADRFDTAREMDEALRASVSPVPASRVAELLFGVRAAPSPVSSSERPGHEPSEHLPAPLPGRLGVGRPRGEVRPGRGVRGLRRRDRRHPLALRRRAYALVSSGGGTEHPVHRGSGTGSDFSAASSTRRCRGWTGPPSCAAPSTWM